MSGVRAQHDDPRDVRVENIQLGERDPLTCLGRSWGQA